MITINQVLKKLLEQDPYLHNRLVKIQCENHSDGEDSEMCDMFPVSNTLCRMEVDKHIPDSSVICSDLSHSGHIPVQDVMISNSSPRNSQMMNEASRRIDYKIGVLIPLEVSISGMAKNCTSMNSSTLEPIKVKEEPSDPVSFFRSRDIDELEIIDLDTFPSDNESNPDNNVQKGDVTSSSDSENDMVILQRRRRSSHAKVLSDDEQECSKGGRNFQ